MENIPTYADDSWDLWTRIKDAWLQRNKDNIDWQDFLATLSKEDLDTCNEFYDEYGDERNCDCSYGCIICLGRK